MTEYALLAAGIALAAAAGYSGLGNSTNSAVGAATALIAGGSADITPSGGGAGGGSGGGSDNGSGNGSGESDGDGHHHHHHSGGGWGGWGHHH